MTPQAENPPKLPQKLPQNFRRTSAGLPQDFRNASPSSMARFLLFPRVRAPVFVGVGSVPGAFLASVFVGVESIPGAFVASVFDAFVASVFGVFVAFVVF